MFHCNNNISQTDSVRYHKANQYCLTSLDFQRWSTSSLGKKIPTLHELLKLMNQNVIQTVQQYIAGLFLVGTCMQHNRTTLHRALLAAPLTVLGVSPKSLLQSSLRLLLSSC